ncbi:MAG: MoaD/ThiS family protein [bacterium]|nr:MoaD/ThiS family protein [bacterium]
MKVHVRYFAVLRDASGVAGEDVEGGFSDATGLWDQLCSRHAFPLGLDSLRVSVNAKYVPTGTALHDGDEVAFIPPVSGG